MFPLKIVPAFPEQDVENNVGKTGTKAAVEEKSDCRPAVQEEPTLRVTSCPDMYMSIPKMSLSQPRKSIMIPDFRILSPRRMLYVLQLKVGVFNVFFGHRSNSN